MANRDLVIEKANALIIPAELKGKLLELIERCPDEQIHAVANLIENYKKQEKAKLESKIKENPKEAKQKMQNFEKSSLQLVSSHSQEKEADEAETKLNKEIDEL